MVSAPTRALRALLRPFARPFLRPIFRRIEEAERRIDEVNQLAVRLDRHLPIVENLIESQNTELRSGAREGTEVRTELGRLKDELVRTQNQVQALREDVALTFNASPPAAVPVEPAAMTQLKQQLGHQAGDLRLSVGFGLPSAPGQVNVDLQELGPGGALAAGLRNLPLDEGSAAEVRVVLALERFTVSELREVVLPYWHWLLKPGGSLVTVSIDAEANLSDHQAGELSLEELARLSLGADDQSVTPRRSLLSEALLTRLLEEAGFQSIEAVARWRAKDAANQIEIRAKRGAKRRKQVEAPARIGVRT